MVCITEMVPTVTNFILEIYFHYMGINFFYLLKFAVMKGLILKHSSLLTFGFIVAFSFFNQSGNSMYYPPVFVIFLRKLKHALSILSKLKLLTFIVSNKLLWYSKIKLLENPK